ncbi:MAG: GMC family oxidoreductase [Bacteroidetes bacterium]|nr:MAG: GMC family oxidoreductase [Bacteroidota bacterium]
MSGGWAAKELCEKGLKTLVLERGRGIEHGTDYVTEHKQPWQLPHRGQTPPALAESDYPVQKDVYLFNESTRHFFINERLNPYKQKKPFSWIRGHQVGGRSLLWARQCYRWSDLDFEANALDGHGVDWPIRYKDIEPWYDYVESFVGISGEALGLPQLPDGIFQKPMEMNAVERHLKGRIENSFPNRRMTIGRCAVLTEELNGRAPCHYCGECERGCSTRSYFSSVSVTLPAAMATGNMTLRPHSNVHSIIYNEELDRATGVRVIDYETREEIEFDADIIFLCASCIGTTQIMMNSTGPRFPNGIANSSGALGHYLMDHHELGASAMIDGFEDDYYEGKRPNGVYIPRFRNIDEPSSREDYIRGFGIQAGASRVGWSRGASEPGFGIDLKEKLRAPGPWTMWMSGFGEALPVFENQVSLSNETDDWGIPIVEIDCAYTQNAYKMREDISVCIQEMFETAGFHSIQIRDTQDVVPGFAIHEMGTARMGRDPLTSVLNAHNQCHDVPNLFVTDGACMTSSACQNPSITYMALTARAVDYAVSAMKRGELHS